MSQYLSPSPVLAEARLSAAGFLRPSWVTPETPPPKSASEGCPPASRPGRSGRGRGEYGVSVNRSGAGFPQPGCVYTPPSADGQLVRAFKELARPSTLTPSRPPQPRGRPAANQWLHDPQGLASGKAGREQLRGPAPRDGLLRVTPPIMKMITKLYGSLTASASERRAEPAVLGLINEL